MKLADLSSSAPFSAPISSLPSPSQLSPSATSCPDDLVALKDMLDDRLDALTPEPRDCANAVHRAMREGLLGPGKRIRPILLLLTGRCFGINPAVLLDAACALEMVHAASLFLDDLPCMDDALQRRGRPALHVQFGEDVTLLSTVALLSQAFRVVATTPGLSPLIRTQVIAALADAVGPSGLVHGQYRDLRDLRDLSNPAVGSTAANEDALASINDLKTGSLFRAAMSIPAMAAGADPSVLEAVTACATEIGLAFQLKDDIEDGTVAPHAARCDDEGRTTLVALLGAESARQKVQGHIRRAEGALRQLFPHDDTLLRLVRQMTKPPQAAHDPHGQQGKGNEAMRPC